MTLDVLFRSIGSYIRRPDHPDLPTDTSLISSLQACDSSEALIFSATSFLGSLYGDVDKGRFSRAQTPMVSGGSRAQTPMTVCSPLHELPGSFPHSPSHGIGVSSDTHQNCLIGSQESKLPVSSNRLTFDTSTIPIVPAVPLPNSGKKPGLSASKFTFWGRLASPQKKHAKHCSIKDSMNQLPQPRRHFPIPQLSSLPLTPDVSRYSVEINPDTDYVVLISMYEVYNDRIFDLLPSPQSSSSQQMTTRQGAALQKGLMRRPLLFKNTEMSPDRKVVAGLRKVVCANYEEAIMVLETGLMERRVAGTGSNSVSSRSHGFFCIEVKQRPSRQTYGHYGGEMWTGGTLSIVDLAGSERARNAKTTGSTLAEAGKINESLMYLGQCLQVQSDCQQDGSKPIVPFRQCKLTELLFSNSFPSPHHLSNYRTPQRAIMIVTADPQGDFNATSQILRYSALAREVTVPRIPSVTSTILGNAHNKATQSGRSTPNDAAHFSTEELEHATYEVTRLSEECEKLAMRLMEEEIKRTETELRLHAAEERIEAIEQQVREDCWAEMEERMEEERSRWREAWDEERTEGEKYLDGKISILEKGTTQAEFVIHEDEFGERMEEVRRENEVLREKVRMLEQEIQGKSPTKKRREKSKQQPQHLNVLGETTANADVDSNPFLTSLRSRDGADDELKLDNKWVLGVTKQIETVRVSDVSPRKLSLRSSSSGSSAGPKQVSGLNGEGAEKENEQGHEMDGVMAAKKAIQKKTRKMTSRMADLGEVE